MNLKQIFRRLRHADDTAFRQMGAFSAMDQKQQEALYAKCEQKYQAAQANVTAPAEGKPQPVTTQTHSGWKAAACAVACLAVCATAAGGIAALYRAAPVPEPLQQAELTAATAVVPDATEAEPAVTVETNAAAAGMAAVPDFQEMKPAPVEEVTEPVEMPEAEPVQPEPEPQPAPAVLQSTAEPVETVPAVTETPTEAAAEWLSYEDEVELPGFRIEKKGENWLIRAEQEHPEFERLYTLQFLPEGAVCIGSDTMRSTTTEGFRGYEEYYRSAEADYDFMQYGRVEPSVNFVAANNEGTAYTSLKPITVAGHNGYLQVFRQSTEYQTFTEYEVGWVPGDRYCMIHAFTHTEDDLTQTILQMAESAVLAE